ncbi:ATP-binding cassette domain-containing protein [Pseudofrankia sp. DC12]|uniref:ATP-binding cassette domain-containing protein n=1 Tax=Pseudofrankia sp. DC12 TaxID=683315 RepID=UPI000A7F6036|nr:ATP-binding cassette domain-containing protein [Pseudofrankia sp. DC12]
MSPMRGQAADDRGDPRSGMSGLAARAERVTKVYGAGDTEVAALRGIDLDFPRGRFTAIMGPSGSGKSTLMHCLAGLDTISGGRVLIGDVDLSRLSDRQLTQLRRDRIGFIFQQYNLLPTLTAAENITLPLDIAGRRADKKWMKVVVDAVGLAPRLNHRPTELSGGQQQRVACARALITRPDIIFGDEPTGNLDSTSGAEVLSFLQDSVRELGQTVVMVTHDAKAASYADEVIFLADGRIVDTMLRPTADAVLDRMKNLDRPAGGRGARRPTSPPPRGSERDQGRDRAGWDDEDGARRRVPTGPGGRRATGPGAARVPTGGQPARRRPTGGEPAGGRGAYRPDGDLAAGGRGTPARRDTGGTRGQRPAPGRGFPADETSELPPGRRDTGGYPPRRETGGAEPRRGATGGAAARRGTTGGTAARRAQPTATPVAPYPSAQDTGEYPAGADGYPPARDDAGGRRGGYPRGADGYGPAGDGRYADDGYGPEGGYAEGGYADEPAAGGYPTGGYGGEPDRYGPAVEVTGGYDHPNGYHQPGGYDTPNGRGGPRRGREDAGWRDDEPDGDYEAGGYPTGRWR